MRFITAVVSCLIFLALVGPAGAARATQLGSCIDSSTTVQAASASATDCDMDQNKAHKCDHDACCGYHLVAIAEVGDFSTPPLRRAAAVAPVVKRLTNSGRETPLKPPRA